MKIYVVESFFDGYVIQYGFSDNEKVAQQKAEQFEKRYKKKAWVTIYILEKDKYVEFESD